MAEADRLPPLTALRAFAVAAQQMSFAKAADALRVTPAAISHQIKALEDHLGVRLFRRVGRHLALTEEGHLLLPGVSDGFARIRAAASLVGRPTRSRQLAVSVPPAFAARWLVPRLERFSHLHPEIDVR